MGDRTPDEDVAGPVVVAVRRAVGTTRGAADPTGTPVPGSAVAALDPALAAAGLAGLVAAARRRSRTDPKTGEGASEPAVGLDAAAGSDSAITAAAPATPSAAILVGIGAVAFTSPALLAQVVDRIEAEGLDVQLIAAVPGRDRDLGWNPGTLATRHGCRSMADPLADLRTSGFGEESLHHGRGVARAWLDADLRIVLAPCATDAAQGFVGTLAALAGLAATIPGADPAEAVADLLAQAPPDLAVLDATVVSHGPVGTAVRRQLRAGTVVAARSALLVDVAAAALLGLDPGVSTTVATCLSEPGLPASYRVDGELARLPGVVTPTVTMVRSLPTTGGAAGVARVLAAAAAVDAGVPGEPGPPDQPRPPTVVIAAGPQDFDPVLAALRSALGPWALAAADSPAAATALAGVQGAAAVAANAVTAWRTTFAKDTLTRREAPLGLDLSAYRAADYEAVEQVLRPLTDQVGALPDTGDPLKWQHLDGSVLFEVSRTVEADYGSWVERVDISHAIRLMADYLGGRCVVVARDRSGRPIRQAERNLYLPQPNYVAFAGGQVIDVCKLEVVRYHRDSREIWWRTVRSPNGSAEYDDGTVEFADVGHGRTRITIRGRQRFTLPLFWQVVDIDRTPGLREVLTTDAYRRFFTTTLDNFVACYEGRPFQIGRRADDRGLPTRDVSLLLGTARQAAQEWLARTAQPAPGFAEGGAGTSGADAGRTAGSPGTALGLVAAVARRWVEAAGSGAGTRGADGWAGPGRPPDEVDDQGFQHFRADGRG